MNSSAKLNQHPLPEVDGFAPFAFIWAVTTLVHQLSFTFWAEFWPGWVLVVAAVAVISKPGNFFRFALLVTASLANLWDKLPFVPNHILFEGMLHLTMLIAIGLQPSCRREILRNLPRLKWFGIALFFKLLWSLSPFMGNVIGGSIGTVIVVTFFCLSYKNEDEDEDVVLLSGPELIRSAAPVLRIALLIMYFWAATQKLNADYLDPEISCAAVLHTEIARYLPFVPTERWALIGAIYGSFFFEIAIPILLMLKPTRRFAFLVAIVFHLWLAIHPAAGIYSFSSLILALLYLFLPGSDRARLSEIWENLCCTLGRGDISKGRKRAQRIVIYGFFAIFLTQGTMFLTIERSFAVFLKANRIGFAIFMVWGLWLSACYLLALWRSRHDSAELTHRFNLSPVAIGLILVLGNGISPWVGLKTQTSFSMYSNLRTEGTTNHLFLKRIDWFDFQNDIVTLNDSRPFNILEPTSKPRGIEQFANPGLKTLTRFELRRQLSRLPADENISVTYLAHENNTRETVSRIDGVVSGDASLFEPIPWWQAKFLWFRRLDRLDGPMPCTH